MSIWSHVYLDEPGEWDGDFCVGRIRLVLAVQRTQINSDSVPHIEFTGDVEKRKLAISHRSMRVSRGVGEPPPTMLKLEDVSEMDLTEQLVRFVENHYAAHHMRATHAAR